MRVWLKAIAFVVSAFAGSFVSTALAAPGTVSGNGYATYGNLSLSRNGAVVAWSVTDTRGERVRVMSNDRDAFVDVLRNARATSPRISPDGATLAFLSDRDTPNQLQLYVANRAGKIRRLTSIAGDVEEPQWSPDGRKISLFVNYGTAGPSGPLVATAKTWGVMGEGTARERRLTIVSVANGHSRIVSDASEYVYEAAWSPRSDRLAIVSSHGGESFENWYVCDLSLVDIATATERKLFHPSLQIAQPVWLDATHVAYLSGLMSDQVSPGGEVDDIDVASRTRSRLVSDPFGGSVTAMRSCGAKTLCLLMSISDETALGRYRAGGAVTIVRRLHETVRDFAANGAGDVAFTCDAFDHPLRVVLVRSGTIARTLDDRNSYAARTWGEPVTVHYTSGGTQYSGWLLYPKDMGSARVPLLVYVHGGPGADATPVWIHAWPLDVLSRAANDGYAVFFPNYRGGFGFGEESTRRIVRTMGRGDVADVLAGVDAATARGHIDKRHVAIYGYSFGASIALVASARTRTFAAVVAGGAVTDWRSYSGENGIDSEVPFFGKTYFEDPHAYDLASPVFYVKGAKTPTLLMQGDADQEVPVTQPFEYWRALRAQHVPSRLLIFHDEGHAYEHPANRAAFTREARAWLRHYAVSKPLSS